jgi:hypothetical protein
MIDWEIYAVPEDTIGRTETSVTRAAEKVTPLPLLLVHTNLDYGSDYESTVIRTKQDLDWFDANLSRRETSGS